MATPTPTPGPTLVDRSALDTELKNLFEAREVSERMARTVEEERAKAEAELVQEVARDIVTTQATPDSVADRVKRWQTENQQKLDKIAALNLLHSKVKQRLEEIKRTHRAEAAQWLRRQIEALLREEGAQETKTRETEAKVKALREELRALRPGKGKSKAKAKGRRRRP
jgi:predicted RNase H-like nuclease (RuvC/YqgF family)